MGGKGGTSVGSGLEVVMKKGRVFKGGRGKWGSRLGKKGGSMREGEKDELGHF